MLAMDSWDEENASATTNNVGWARACGRVNK